MRMGYRQGVWWAGGRLRMNAGLILVTELLLFDLCHVSSSNHWGFQGSFIL